MDSARCNYDYDQQLPAAGIEIATNSSNPHPLDQQMRPHACQNQDQTLSFAFVIATVNMSFIQESYSLVASSAAMKTALTALRDDHERSLQELIVINEIPAPPFKEERRGNYLLQRFQALGLTDSYIDSEGNVLGLRRGTGEGPKLLVSAHLDTVFPEGTDVSVTKRDGKLYGAGISDNGRGLALLLSWVKVLQECCIDTVGDILFAANVGEEGLGDLRGMKAIFRDIKDIDGMIGLEPPGQESGRPDELTTTGTGSIRYEFKFIGPGGHSFEHFGLPSAIHAMGRAIAHISEIRTPQLPKTTFNVGTVKGGTSVNTIAAQASVEVDIRSNANPELLAAEQEVLSSVARAVAEENARWGSDSLRVETRMIGNRPSGQTPDDSPIVETFVNVITGYGRRSPSLVAHSADANIPMSLGIPALTISNTSSSGNQHTIHEWLDPVGGWQEAQIGMLGILTLVGIAGTSSPTLAKRI